MSIMIPVGVSNRHVHLSKKHLIALFGEGYELTNIKNLSQPGEFAAKETLTIAGPKGEIGKVRILGPVRKETQVEISNTDSFVLGVAAPVRMSGNIEGTPGIDLIGPKARITIDKGVIVAMRHIHMRPEDATKFDVTDNEIVQVKIQGVRQLIFNQVVIRVSESFALDCHIDRDEANAAGLKTGDKGELIKSSPIEKEAELQLV
jgi:putative phosphotransacetylase